MTEELAEREGFLLAVAHAPLAALEPTVPCLTAQSCEIWIIGLFPSASGD